VAEAWELAWVLALALVRVQVLVQAREPAWALALVWELVPAWVLVRVSVSALWELFQSSVILETTDLRSL
jgi:hypothetical protein